MFTKENWIHILTLFLMLFFSCFIMVFLLEKEAFSLYIHEIDFYIITMNNPDRLKHVEEQIEKIKKENVSTIERVEAIPGKDLDPEELIQKGIVLKDAALGQEERRKKNEIACSLSHMKTYDIISKKNKPENYSIIIEDDFIFDPDFKNKLHAILETSKDIDFDYLFLGINGGLGEAIKKDIYKVSDGVSYGTYGYMVNNKNIDKIIKEFTPIGTTTDVHIFNLGKSKKLNVYRIEKTIIQHRDDFGTEIR